MAKQTIARGQVTIVSQKDANLLDWVEDWNTNKTTINSNAVVTPKIFAGERNLNGTLSGIAIGKFPLNIVNSSGQVVTEIINGVYGFKDGYKTFFVDNDGNAQFGRGDQFIKYNSSTGKIEFGTDVSMLWAGATYIDANGVFTGTLSANTVKAIKINASQITAGTINVELLNVAALKAALITASNIEALTLNVTKGKIGGWNIDADSISGGGKNNTSGSYTTEPGAITIGSNGIRGYKWKLDSTGAGAVAGGNICWDAEGNVSFGTSVSINWINAANDAMASAKESAQAMAFGKMLYRVPEFFLNGAVHYNGTSNYLENAVRSIEVTEGCPNSTGYALKYVATDWHSYSDKRIGGFSFANPSRHNAVFVTRIIALIPDGRELQNYNEPHGTDYEDKWLTSNKGTGKWEEYIYKTTCGPSGIFRSINHFALTGGETPTIEKPVTWLVAYATVFDVSSSERYVTTIDANGVYTGTLSANQINAGTLDADRIASGSITANKLDAASIMADIINVDYINGLSFTFIQGKIANWNIETDSIFQGIKNNTSGEFTGSSTFITIGSNGIRGYKWRFDSNGSGALAGGGISWDASGNVIFDSNVSIQWTAPIADIESALGGNDYPKLTKIDSTGIYTGTLNASQINAGTISADRIAAGSINASKLNVTNVQASIVTASAINALTCDFVRGKIGGWNIGSDYISTGILGAISTVPIQLRATSNGTGYWYNGSYKPMGLTMAWYNTNNSGHIVFGQIANSANSVRNGYIGLQMMAHDSTEYFCLSACYTTSGQKQVYNRIAGWSFDENAIYSGIKNNNYGNYTMPYDITIGSTGIRGNKWRLEYNGSGAIAGGNISWDSLGNVTFSSSVQLNWTSAISATNTNVTKIVNALGGSSYPKLTRIDAYGIYTGTVRANQIVIDSSLIVGGSSYNGSISVRDATNNIVASLSRTGIYAIAGTIGGWQINDRMIFGYSDDKTRKITMRKNGYFYCIGSNSSGAETGYDYWALHPTGKAEFGYGKILFREDGSGFVANGNIQWNTTGSVTMTGTINATAGVIGGFTISGNRLINKASNTSIEFSTLTGSSSLSINGNTEVLLSMRADSARTAINIQTYASGAKGIFIIANTNSSNAIESYGPHLFGQRSSERWNAPGVLFSAVVKNSNTLYNQWGNGLTVSSFVKSSTGIFTCNHNLGHTQYTVIATPYWDTGTNWHGNSYVRVEAIGANSFKLRVVNADNGLATDTCFTFAVIGRNKF